ncbi:MAG: hypothetical protein ABID54_04335 [Pseudomonadota bacterium]
MPEQVSIREDLGLIHIDSYGEVSELDLIQSLEAAVKINKDRGLNRVFVNATRQRLLPSTSSLAHFRLRLSEEAGTLKHAVVANPDLTEALQFIEAGCRNCGMELQVFDSPEVALAWLNE